MGSTIVEQDFPYDILKRGVGDAARHNKRVNEALRKQLKDIIGQQDIITSEGNKKIKVRLKYLDQYRFIHNHDWTDVVGRDQYDEMEEGEILSRPARGGEGKPTCAGEGDGGEIYEAEYTIQELTDIMLEELHLPDLDETKKNIIVSEVLQWTDRRKQSGVMNLVDKKQTLLANILRKKKLGVPKDKILPIINDDLRFRTWDIAEERNSNAVVLAMMDRSGSMWEDKIYAVKALYFWIVQFLRRRYDRVEIRFIAHDSIARELNEKEFFSIADGGGTSVSSAYHLCNEIIRHDYPPESWNVYAFHASDGDTWGDEEECAELVKEMMRLGVTMFAYTEVNIDSYRDDRSDLFNALDNLRDTEDGVVVSVINSIDDVLYVLSAFLRYSVRRESELV